MSSRPGAGIGAACGWLVGWFLLTLDTARPAGMGAKAGLSSFASQLRDVDVILWAVSILASSPLGWALFGAIVGHGVGWSMTLRTDRLRAPFWPLRSNMDEIDAHD